MSSKILELGAVLKLCDDFSCVELLFRPIFCNIRYVLLSVIERICE